MTNHPDKKTGLRQRDEVLAYMREFGSITPLDALVDLGVMRLAARIDELAADYPIGRETISVPRRRRPGMARVRRYWLKGAE